jgi:hypothetical protein
MFEIPKMINVIDLARIFTAKIVQGRGGFVKRCSTVLALLRSGACAEGNGRFEYWRNF